MADPEVEAIVCARGGYGAMRIIDDLPWEAFVARPKWLVGFSDVTALHVVANARACLQSARIQRDRPRPFHHRRRARVAHTRRSKGCRCRRGRTSSPSIAARTGSLARGPLVGGNLALLAGMAAGNRLAVPEGAILAFEDVTERPYRLDRMLTSLRLGGHLARALRDRPRWLHAVRCRPRRRHRRRGAHALYRRPRHSRGRVGALRPWCAEPCVRPRRDRDARLDARSASAEARPERRRYGGRSGVESAPGAEGRHGRTRVGVLFVLVGRAKADSLSSETSSARSSAMTISSSSA